MSKILDIREFSSLGSSKKTQPLSFSANGTVNNSVFDWAPSTDQNWTNQEIAEFYRVKKFFSLYKIFIVTDTGLSDEGDPWFVYCNHQGEVFAHFCKIDGKYLLDSPRLAHVIIALSLRELVDKFCAEELDKNKKLDELKNNVVVLHPAIQFTSLILALYVATDPMGSKAHAETNTSINEAYLNFNVNINSNNNEVQNFLADKKIEENNYKLIHKNLVTKFDLNDQELYISLATIAGIASYIAYSIKFYDDANNLLTQINEFNADNYIPINQSANLNIDNFNSIIASMDDQLISHVDNKFLKSDEQFNVIEINNDQFHNSTYKIEPENEPDRATKANNDNFKYSFLNVENLQINTLSEIKYNIDITQNYSHSNKAKNNTLNLDQFKESLVSLNKSETISSITINSLTDNNSYILNELAKINGFEKIISFSGLVNTTNFYENTYQPLNMLYSSTDTKNVNSANNLFSDTNLQTYSDQVRQILDFILNKGDHITILNLPKEVIFVDDTAMSSFSDKITARSWSTKDGGVISLVGYVKDFSDFKLLAS